MAQRFGGKYSPQPMDAGPSDNQGYSGVAPGRAVTASDPAHPLARRPVWLVVAAIPFLPSAFGDGPGALIRGLGAFALVAGAAFLIREGLRAEAAWQARSAARRPVLPRKIIGAIAFGLGLGLGAGQAGIFGELAIGAVGAALALIAFGPDPMHDKGMAGFDGIQHDRAARAIAEGEKRLTEMREAIRRTGDIALSDRVERFARGAQDLFRAVERDPGDLALARRYMGVYLEGARDATLRFVELWSAHRDAGARAAYEALLTDLETDFAARTRTLIEGGRQDLTLEIEVLRERLSREGVSPQPDPATEPAPSSASRS